MDDNPQEALVGNDQSSSVSEETQSNSVDRAQSKRNHSPIQILKKSSPLKHVTPIIKKYDCQRQAKNGKSVKVNQPVMDMKAEDSSIQTVTPVQDLVAGMDSLDAALRRAEKCLAGNKEVDQPPDSSLGHQVEPTVDDTVDADEEMVSSTTVTTNLQTTGGVRSSQLRNRNRVLKKRNQLQKDLEHALPLAATDPHSVSDERSSGYALGFFQKVKDRFEVQNSLVFEKFLKILEGVESNAIHVPTLYHQLMEVFDGHPDICQDFLGCLLPCQALQCGKFMEHLAFMEISSYLQKLELYFAKQPQQLRKIFASFARLIENSDLTIDTVRSTVLPLLRGNTTLIDGFLELFPSEKPPESKMTDFDTLTCEDMDSEQSGEEDVFERVDVPPDNEDPFGGENCQCCCHSNTTQHEFQTRAKHCVTCGMKFISGKVFMQTDHGLRPVKIDFNGGGTISSNIKRLNSGLPKMARSRSRRKRISAPQILNKTDDCRQTETDDEATLSSKVKSPRQRPKISKQTREKQTSSKSLSLSRPRKPSVTKLSSSPLPVILDQEALPAPCPSEAHKSSTLDFSRLSEVIQMDQDHDDKVEEFKVEDTVTSTESNKQFLTATTNGSNVHNLEEDAVQKKNEDVAFQMNEGDCHLEHASLNDVDERGRSPDISMDVSGASSDCDVETLSTENKEATWTREEDRIILCTFQSGFDRDKTLQKISEQLPLRTVDQINSRFHCLMSLIKEMELRTS